MRPARAPRTAPRGSRASPARARRATGEGRAARRAGTTPGSSRTAPAPCPNEIVNAPPPSQGPVRRTVDIRREMKLCGSCGHRFSGEAMFCPFDGAKLEKVAYDPLGDPLLGSTVDGRYEVMELLGEGGMGRVYEVRHVALDRRFAMKVLRRDLARDEELAARFIQEAKATASVRHPNVVEITDFGRMPDGVPYFVMELLVGETLGHVIKSGGPIPSKRAVRILKQVTSALAAAH